MTLKQHRPGGHTNPALAPEQVEEMCALATDLRRVAVPIGSMSGLWDYIFELEELLDGRPTIHPTSVEESILRAKDALGRHLR